MKKSDKTHENFEKQKIIKTTNCRMDCMDTCHRFNLNVHPPTESRKEESNDPNHLKQRLDDAGFDQRTSNIEEGGNLVEMMSRIEKENVKIMKSLAELFDKYEAMHHQLIDLMKIKSRPKTDFDEEDDDDDHELNNHGKKRKASDLSYDKENNYGNGNASIHSCISEEVCCRRARLINYKPKISTAFIRIDQSDTSLVVKDGYQWRKYGQKVTRDNPSPRAYYKCSFAPLCSVKKKVQRSIDDTTVLVVTYEGEHNHKKPPSGATLSPSSTQLLIEPEDDVAGGVFQPRLVEHMASTLTKDPSFTSALASAIYSKVLQKKSF